MKGGSDSRTGAGSIVDVPGIEVGNAQDAAGLTGCTVVLCRRGAVGGVDVRGSAPGTRETDLLNPLNLVQRLHAVMLAGGSAYGLDAASGAMRYLEQKKIGFKVGTAIVPIVPAAILYDLGFGGGTARPDADMGYAACRNASRSRFREGNVGAGTGASVGKLFGSALAMKSGLGTASLKVGGVTVGAVVAVNSLGDVIEPQTGEILAGLRSGRVGPLRVGGPERFADTFVVMRSLVGRGVFSLAARSNTLIGVVATDAALTKSEATKVAQMAQDGVARSVRPAHTMLDGDALFALSAGRKRADVSLIGSCAAEVVARASARAVRCAASAGGLPGLYQG